MDTTYTGGVIAVRETQLLKDRIFKLCEGTAQEAFGILSDCGFGRSAEVASVYGYESMLAADELEIDGFVREYAPSDAEKQYFLSARDFHNAKAAVKAEYLGISAEGMLASDGLASAEQIVQCVKTRDTAALYPQLKSAVEEALALFDGGEERKDISGAEIGIIFDRAAFLHLLSACGKNRDLKKLTVMRIDITNILTALRAQSAEYAAMNYIYGGRLSENTLDKLSGEREIARCALDGTPYEQFIKNIFSADGSLALSDAERAYESLEAEYFEKNKYELKRSQPFLYYVFRRKCENANVRIVLGCLLAGVPEQEIKKRLRAV